VFTALLALWLIRSEIPDRRRSLGLVVGFAGVVALLGIDVRGDAAELLGAGAMILSVRLRGIGTAVPALAVRHAGAGGHRANDRHLQRGFSGTRGRRATRQIPPTSSIVALATLGIVNTGVAYWLFYLLINEAGAATASVITYVMPVVALFLGVGLLGERLTGAIAGLILIVLGAWLAISQRAPGDVLASVGRRRTVAADLLQRDGDGGSSIRSWPRRMTSSRAPGRSRRSAPGLGGNSDGSVARPDGDPGFKIASGVTDAAGSSFPLVRRLASYTRRQVIPGRSRTQTQARPALGRRTGKGR
jgi:hypothetical protein